jgi:hypothetical protein
VSPTIRTRRRGIWNASMTNRRLAALPPRPLRYMERGAFHSEVRGDRMVAVAFQCPSRRAFLRPLVAWAFQRRGQAA